MMTTDLALVGRLGDGAVAAAALASSVFFITFTFGMGLVSAVAPLAAQAFGARNPRMVRRSLRVGLWAALLISLPMILPPLYGEADPVDAGPGAGHRAAGAGISAGSGLGHCAGAVVSRHPRLHGRGQPAGAGIVDHAGGDPGQCRAGLSADPRRMGTAAAGIVRRRPRHHDDQFRHVPGGAVVCAQPPAVPEISRAGPHLAHRLDADAAADRDRRADLDLVPAGIRPVFRRGPADGPDQHHRAGGASDRASSHRHPVHGAVRHQHRGHRAGRACRRPQRCGCASSARASSPRCSAWRW